MKLELVMGAGLLTVLAGVWWIWPPLALILGGAGVAWAAVLTRRAQLQKRRDGDEGS